MDEKERSDTDREALIIQTYKNKLFGFTLILFKTLIPPEQVIKGNFSVTAIKAMLAESDGVNDVSICGGYSDDYKQ